MKTLRSNRSHISQRPLRCLAIGVLALGIGCASTLEDSQLAGFEGMREPITAFSRNPIVCAPTALGNTVGGLIGAPLALAVFPLVWPATLFTSDDDYLFQIYGTTFWGPVLLTGGAIGGVFYPLSLLADENPCSFGTEPPQPSQY
ncbi:MAG: hypothetical protein JRH16_03435 [Deltaproteobacteria bacterium]|nr:hypothetical protein [Deltaproteobacteria bacterium]MBW2360219.1 hypothetical protein [Deltaproteobacteria bacterium]